MKAVRTTIALLLVGYVTPIHAYSQNLPTISPKMVLITASFSADNDVVVQQTGPLALTSIAFSNDGPAAVKV